MKALDDELTPKEASELLPHIPYKSIKNKMDKLRSNKKRKLGETKEDHPDRGMFLFHSDELIIHHYSNSID